MEKTKKQPYGWWFDSRNATVACSPWLHSTLSELNEKTRSMLRMIEDDADTFTQRVEMYYEKRPQLISLVEDLYRAQRSLLEQFDHLRHDARHCHSSPDLVCSNKSCDACVEFAYESEVDDLLPEVYNEAKDFGNEFAFMRVKHEDLMKEIKKLKEEKIIWNQQIMDQEETIEELQWKISKSENEVLEEINLLKRRYLDEMERAEIKLKEEIENLKADNDVLNNQLEREGEEMREDTVNLIEELRIVKLKNEEQCEILNMKDEEKREVIRHLSLAVAIVKEENVLLKRCLASKR